MNDHELTEAQIDRLLDGHQPGSEGEAMLARTVERIRIEYRSDAPPVGAALAEFVSPHFGAESIGATRHGADHSIIPLVPHADHTPSRRHTTKTTLAAFVGTITGKIVIGGSVALAAAGGAQAAGIVDIPGLPDDGQATIVTVDSNRTQKSMRSSATSRPNRTQQTPTMARSTTPTTATGTTETTDSASISGHA